MKFKIRNLNEPVIELNKHWKMSESNILNEMKILTGLNFDTSKITCYIDGSTADGYYGSKTITLGVKGGITLDDALMVISHELFHIYYWKKIKKMGLTKSSPGKELKKEWELAEVTAFLLTNEPSLKKYWSNAKVYLYPEIKETYDKVKNLWKIEDFDDYLINSYKLINAKN